MEWGWYHWLDNLTRILQKFESGQTDKYLFFYKICKFTNLLKKIKKVFPKKNTARAGSGRAGPIRGRGRPTLLGRAQETDLKGC
jgi:hypothetical protein